MLSFYLIFIGRIFYIQQDVIHNYLFWNFTGFVYIRVLSFWAFVLIIDFLLEFRLELLWPLWLFMTSVYDSFKYQGLVRIIVSSLIVILQVTRKYSSFTGLFSILCVFVTDSRFSLLSFHPSSVALFCCTNICMDTICLAYR